MSEELKISAEQAELEKIEKVKLSLDKIVNKKSKFLFVVPESQNPVASVYEIYFHATVVKNLGYEVVVMVEKGDYVPPAWIEKELTDHKHMSMADPKLTVGPEDIMVIPEVYSNIMEQTKNLPCLRVGLLQSVDYMTSSLIPGTDWSSFGIQDVITTSQSLKEWLETFYGVGKYSIETYNIGIPEYFERSEIPQKPVISVIGRNANEISKFVKLFFSKYPQYNWVTFDPMVTKSKPPQPMRRVDFAKRLQGNFAAIWIDRISSFGTFPLECMKSGTIPICLKPDIMPEYMIERDENGVAVKAVEGGGVWTENYYDLPVLAGDVLVKFLDDNINPELYNVMETIASKYNQTDSEIRLVEIYSDLAKKRIALLESALQPTEKPVEEKIIKILKTYKMNISVIIPIHEYNDELSLLVTKSVESVIRQEDIDELPQILLVYPPELDANIVGLRDSMIRKHQVSGVTHQNFVLIKNEGATDYQSQVNLAVDAVTTDYFSVLEFDDEYGSTYFRNVAKYIKTYSEVDIFLTMMIEVNEKNEGIKLTNETVWAQQFVGENGEMGYLNVNALKQYTDFKLSGAVIKKSDFKNLGGYKVNIKLTFMYEFLLRALNNASKIYSIPKIGYKHLATRKNSLFDNYMNNMPIDERKFWFETATKESNFMNDRPIDLSRLLKVVTE